MPGSSDIAPEAVSPSATAPTLLSVRDLRVRYHLAGPASGASLTALHAVSLQLARGEALGIAGETGSGKTTLALALIGLLPTAHIEGAIEFDGQPLPVADDAAMRAFRWRRIAVAFQSAGTAFDPVYRVGEQVIEPLTERLGLEPGAARARAQRLWNEVGLPPDRFEHYPHQLSGGEKQRAMLAMALACEPDLLILDEPTAGLDAVTRAAVLDLLRRLRDDRRFGLILISHNLDDFPRVADRLLILYAGRMCEVGPARELLAVPRHPYSWGLVNAFPTMTRVKDLWGIRGEPPDPLAPPPGCPFAPRCTQAVERCHREIPPLVQQNGRGVACHLGGLQVLLEACGLRKAYRDSGRQGGAPIAAIQDVSLRLHEGEVVAIVGQTGSGKTTLAKLLVGLLEPDEGAIVLQGRALGALRGAELKAARRQIQMIFQDPFDALSPRLTVLELVREPLDIQRLGSRTERDGLVRQVLTDVRLPITANFLVKRGHELSGGQLQRVAIARALILRPKVIVADEPVSMLDPSEQARVLRLLKDLQNEYGTGLLLVSHDLGLVRKVADRIVVLERGRIVEEGLAEHVVSAARHPSTRRLLAAASGSPVVPDPSRAPAAAGLTGSPW